VRKSWATSGVDLHLDVPGTRVRAGLEGALREAVRTGRLAAGTRLPSSRALAADLGIARNTVAEAYSQLVAEGWLTARQGSGTQVAAPPSRADLPAGPGARPEAGPPPPAEAVPPGPAEVPTATGRDQPRYELRAGLPDLSSFPRSAWLAASRRALNAAPTRALGYGDPRGRPELRRALAEYLARARGVRVSPARVVICTGFTQGLDLLCRVLASRGATTMALEAYGLPGSLATLAAHGLTPALLPVDEGGAVLDGATEAQALLLTPAHQFPLGPALAANRRAQAVQWAASTGGLVIEDDYDGEFRYDRQPVGALQALAPDQVVYTGTASKTLAPGLRLGWLVLPAGLVNDVAEAKAQADAHTGSFEQLTLAEFISSGGYDRHIRRSRLGYRRRRDRLVAELARHAPGVRLTGIAAGLHAVAELPGGQSEQDVTARAARRSLWVEGLGNYARGEHTRGPALVIGYAAPAAHAFTAALARLCATLADSGG
jgi:GntR family transcriptional regulator / MocR family aminotransferase